MKNRFATRVVAVTTSAVMLGTGLAHAQDFDYKNFDYNKCVDSINKTLSSEEQGKLVQDCQKKRDIAKDLKDRDERQKREAAKNAAAAERQKNYGSIDASTWKDIDKELANSDKKYEDHPYPGWLALLKYVQIIIEQIVKQVKPIFEVGNMLQKLAPKA